MTAPGGPTATPHSAAVDAAAARLLHAAATGQPCEPLRDLLPATLQAGYEVQDALTRHWAAQGRRPVGRKIGLTNPKGYPVAIAMFTALLSSSADTLSWVSFAPLLGAACIGFILADIVLIAFVGASFVRRLYRRHDVWIARASGLIFIGFGLHAIYEAAPGLLGRRD